VIITEGGRERIELTLSIRLGLMSDLATEDLSQGKEVEIDC
jgi:hypothetical protein